MPEVAEQLESLRQRIADRNEPDMPGAYLQRLAITPTASQFNLDFYGASFDAKSSCFPDLYCLEWGEYNETHMDDYLANCTPVDHYRELFQCLHTRRATRMHRHDHPGN